MQKRKGLSPLEFLVVVAIIAILILLLIPAVKKAREAAERQMQRTEETQAWPFEKYFENRGNGVYHVEGSDIFQRTFGGDEPTDPARVRTTQEFATVLGEWRQRHPELRITSCIHYSDGTTIIITERR